MIYKKGKINKCKHTAASYHAFLSCARHRVCYKEKRRKENDGVRANQFAFPPGEDDFQECFRTGGKSD